MENQCEVRAGTFQEPGTAEQSGRCAAGLKPTPGGTKVKKRKGVAGKPPAVTRILKSAAGAVAVPPPANPVVAEPVLLPDQYLKLAESLLRESFQMSRLAKGLEGRIIEMLDAVQEFQIARIVLGAMRWRTDAGEPITLAQVFYNNIMEINKMVTSLERKVYEVHRTVKQEAAKRGGQEVR